MNVKHSSAAVAISAIAAAAELFSSAPARADSFELMTVKLYPNLRPCLVNGIMKEKRFLDFLGDGVLVGTIPYSDNDIIAMGYECWTQTDGSVYIYENGGKTLIRSIVGPLIGDFAFGGAPSALNVGLTLGNGLYSAATSGTSWKDTAWKHCGEVKPYSQGVITLNGQKFYKGEADGGEWLLCQFDGQKFTALPKPKAFSSNAAVAVQVPAATPAPVPVVAPAPAPVAAQPPATSTPVSLLASPPPAASTAVPSRPIAWSFGQFCQTHTDSPQCK